MTDGYVPDQSESLDGDELGEDPFDDRLPGIGDYPPEESRGVEDPSLAGPDDVSTRELRRDIDDAVPDDDPVDLIEPDDARNAAGEDVESAALGDEADPEPGEPIAPEVGAVHIADEP